MSHDTTISETTPPPYSHGSAEKALDLSADAFDNYWSEVDERYQTQAETSHHKFDPPGYHDDEPASSRRETPDHDDDEDRPVPRSRKQSARPSEVFSEKPDFSVFGSPFTEPPIEQVKVEEEKPKDEAKPKEEKPAKVTAEKADKEADDADADEEATTKAERKAKGAKLQEELDALAELDGQAIPPKVRKTINALNSEAKKLRAESEATNSKLKELEKERDAYKAGRPDPPAPAVYQRQIEALTKEKEELKQYEIKTRLSNHPEFRKACAEPVEQRFDSIVNKCVDWCKRMGIEAEKVDAFDKAIREAGADGLSAEQWQDHVLKSFTDAADDDAATRQHTKATKEAVIREINDLLQLRQRRDAIREHFGKDPSSYDKFARESAQKLIQDRQQGFIGARPQLEQEFAAWNELKDPAKKAALEREITPLAEKYLQLINCEHADGVTQGRNWALVSFRAAAHEHKSIKAQQENLQLRRQIQLLQDDLVSAGVYDKKTRSKGKDSDLSDAELKKSLKAFSKAKK